MKTTFATIVLLSLLFAVFAYAQVPILWQHTDGPYGGVIYALVDDGDGRLFAATEGDGIFRSEDNGETWIETTNGLGSGVIFCLAVNKGGDVFAGTDGAGIYRLNVGSTTWTAVNSGLITTNNPSAVVYSIAVNDSGHVFAGLLFRGVYRSTDNGANWTVMNNGLGSNIDILAVSVNENDELFVSTLFEGVFKSTDNGVSWVYIGLRRERVYAFLLQPSGEIFAGRWRSPDNGENWFPTFPPGTVWSFLRTQSGTVYASTSAGVFEYASGINGWIQIGTGLPSVSTLSVIQRTNGEIFVATGGRGVYRLEGDNWQRKTEGITNLDVRAIARGNGSYLYAATYWSGIFRSTDDGASWSITNAGTDIIFPVCIMVTPTGTVLVGTWRIVDDVVGGKIFRSTDNGESWEKVFTAKADAEVWSLVYTPGGEIVAGMVGDTLLYKSSDDGLTWVGTKPNNLSTLNFFSLSVNPSGHLFAGTLSSGLVRSEDEGANWISAQSGLPVPGPGELYPQVQAMAFSGSTSFAGTYGKGVYTSTSNGNSWTQVSAGLPQTTYVRSFAINQQGDLFVGTEGGVYRMLKFGSGWSNNWSAVNSGLGNTFVRSVVATASGHMVAGTSGSGIYRTVTPTTGVQIIAGEIPRQFSLEQNYPNPFNPKTNFGFQVAKLGFVTLRVFDLLGKEVATVLSEELPPGIYTIPWDASALPSGVYFYRLQSGSFVETKRALLLK